MLAAFGVFLSRMSARRGVQEAGRNARAKMGAGGHIPVIGADETYVRINGEKTVAGVVADAATGQIIGLDVLVERDSDGFIDWRAGYARDFGSEAIADDDKNTYKPAAWELELDHQICIARAKKRAKDRPDGMEGAASVSRT